MAKLTDINRKKKFIINTAYAALGLAIYYLIFRYAIRYAWPFVLALLFAMILKKPSYMLAKKLKINARPACVIVLVVFYFVLVGGIGYGLYQTGWSLGQWISTFYSGYSSSVEPALKNIFDWYEERVAPLGGDTAILDTLGDQILSWLSGIVSFVSSRSISFVQSMAIGLPKFLIGFIFMIVSSFYILLDIDGLSYFLLRQFTPNQQQIIVSSEEYLGEAIGRLLLSYFAIMSITFVELNIGLRIIGIENATLVSLVIAVFDILPALGTGGIVIPWAVIRFINGDVKTAVQLAVMYVIITIIRNAIEPKIVGDNIGVHPVLMLMSMYLGATIFGAIGIIIVPFTIVVVKKLNDAGLISVFNSDYKQKDAPREKKRVLKKKKKKESEELADAFETARIVESDND